MKKRILKIFLSLVALCLALLGLSLGITQTAWFKSKIEEVLLEQSQKAGWTLQIQNLQSKGLFKWEIGELSLQTEAFALDAKQLQIKLALLPLLQGDIGIADFHTRQLTLSSKQAEKEPDKKLLFDQLEAFPLNVSVRKFSIDDFRGLQIKGSAKIRAKAKDLICSIRIKGQGVEQELFAVGGTRKGQLELRLKILADDWAEVYNFKGRGQIDIHGPWITWKALASNSGSTAAVLQAEVSGWVDRLKFENATWDSPSKIRLSFEMGADRTIAFKNALVHGPLLEIAADGRILKDGSIKEAKYSIKIPSLAPFSLHSNLFLGGALSANGTIKNGTSQSAIEILNGRIGALQFESLQSSVSLFKHENEWKGTLKLSASEKNLHLAGESALRLSSSKLYFSDLSLKAPMLDLGGDFYVDYKTHDAEGTLRLQASDLSTLQPFFPKSHLAGSAGFEIHFLKNEAQRIKAYGTMQNFHVGQLTIGQATVALKLQIINKAYGGDVEFHGEQIYLPDVYISDFDLRAAGEQAWNYTIDSKGTWKEPFHLLAKGVYTQKEEVKQIQLHELEGTFLSDTVKLNQPCQLQLSKAGLNIEAPSIKLGSGELSLFYRIAKEDWNLNMNAKEIPLASFALFTPWMSLSGDATLSCALTGDHSNVEGSCQLSVKNVNAKRFGAAPVFQAKGSLFANFSGKNVQIHSELNAAEAQIVLVDATVPLRLQKDSYFPLRADVNAPFAASLLLEGKLEEFSEFFKTGFHRWSGWVAGKIIFSHTMIEPLMRGDLTVSRGSYENDYLGLKIENVEATIEATRDEFMVTSLQATGKDRKGTLTGGGILRLRPEYFFPYRFHFESKEMPIVSLDLVEATVTGTAEIEGTSQKAILRGSLVIDDATFSIPRSLPKEIVELPVTYVNQPTHVQTSLTQFPQAFPFHFDINFRSADSIHFNAGGLNSLWGGNFHLHGVNFNLLASGNLRLAKGQFSLLGKTFQLTQGEISFSDKSGYEGLINISGTLNLNDVIITAQLRGTLSAPQLTLQSIPPMTTSDIFSLILFNKKMAEIKPMQAVQLARTVMAMSISSGWNFVDQIGSGLNILGIDTFDVIPSEHGLNQTSITIGKHFYLVRGVMVSLTQSLSSSRFMVEVDLGKGLIFQAENESDENQAGQVGKFSLKWNKNY